MFEPLQLKSLSIRNRFVSSPHCPAFGDNGVVADRDVPCHAEMAKGGVGLPRFGGAATVPRENPSDVRAIRNIHASTLDVVRICKDLEPPSTGADCV